MSTVNYNAAGSTKTWDLVDGAMSQPGLNKLSKQGDQRAKSETRTRAHLADEHVWRFHDKYHKIEGSGKRKQIPYAECVECSHVIGFLIVTPEIAL